MRKAITVFKAALSVSFFVIAACSGAGSNSSSVASTVASLASVKSAVSATQSSAKASLSGTTIPSAAQITDAGANVWTVIAGVIYENGSLAGYSNEVALLLYDKKVIYQENTAGGWWSWNGSTWIASSDPRKKVSPDGSTIPGEPQITDASDNVWVVSGGVIYANGVLAGYSNEVVQLAYDGELIYQENAAGGWWSWNGSTWVASSEPPRTPSPSGTVITSAGQITDASDNLWTVSGGVIYENGALAGYSNAVVRLVYDNSVVYQENSAGGWWSWTGGTWVSSSAPVNGSGGTGGTAPTIAGGPVTTDLVGEAYSFLPTTTNAGGGTLSFSIQNMPAWASFSTETGELTGTPSNSQTGTYAGIVISVSNGSASASLTAFSITVTTGSATLTWVAPSENTNGTPITDLAGYKISYGTSPGSLTQTIQVANPSATSYIVGNLGSGTYYFSVAAYTSDGMISAQSAAAEKTVL